MSVANQKPFIINVTKGQLSNVNVANSFVPTMEEYIKEPVEGHYVANEYVQVKNLIVIAVPPSMDFNGGTTDLFDVDTKKSIDASKSFNHPKFSFECNVHINLKRVERARVTITKIPAMAYNLISKTLAWEDEKKTCFLYEGVHLVELLEDYKTNRGENDIYHETPIYISTWWSYTLWT